MTIYAYARISTDKQNIEMQLDALKNHGYDHLFQEQESSKKERPQLQSLKSKLRSANENRFQFSTQNLMLYQGISIIIWFKQF